MENPIPRLLPDRTPSPLKGLLLALGLAALASGLFFRTLVPLLGLSLAGIEQGWFWQIAAYPFALSGPLNWVSLFFLGFELLLLWIYSAPLVEQKGAASFFCLFSTATLLGGGAALAGMLQNPALLTGFAPALFAVLTAWAFLNPQGLFWFFGVPLKAKATLITLLALDLMIRFSQDEWAPLLSNGTGALIGYLYYRLPLFQWSRGRGAKRAKIYDFQSGRQVQDDEKFMDAMLARIALNGEISLTREEKVRMKKISEKLKKLT